MIGLIGRLANAVSSMSLVRRCAWLAGVLLVAMLAAGCFAAARGGLAEVRAVVIAGSICTVCSGIALVLAMLWRDTPNGVVGVLAGTLFGLFPPLVTGLSLQRRGGELAEAGIFGWIVVFYLTALTVKTLLVAPTTGSSPRRLRPPVDGAAADVVQATKAGA